MNRLMDFTAALVLLLLTWPLLLALAVVVWAGSGRPVLFRSERVGLRGRRFMLYKFRSMIRTPSPGPSITRRTDPRVTAVGRWLRRTKLDELPQLFNIARGDMAFVGPRPEVPDWVARYTPEQRQVLSVRPGLTSVASLQFRDEEERLSGPDWEEQYGNVILPSKIRMELDYLAGRTLWRDLGVIVQTVVSLAR
jgi:lipopolysaccharide/colanic/teichoic acid biosynthesis glycosyltransferase